MTMTKHFFFDFKKTKSIIKIIKFNYIRYRQTILLIQTQGLFDFENDRTIQLLGERVGQ